MKDLHLICNAHIDPVWLWDMEEGISAAISTFRMAAVFCEEYDGLVFNHNEALIYHWIEEMEPALFARIRKLVKEGKWHIMGGWYLQPDCNMPSGESFIRQMESGREYFLEKFGEAPSTAINFDPFGHSRGLVQLMAKAGYDSYLFCRPGQGNCPLPADDFIWVGFDGSEIIRRQGAVPLSRTAEKIGVKTGLCHELYQPPAVSEGVKINGGCRLFPEFFPEIFPSGFHLPDKGFSAWHIAVGLQIPAAHDMPLSFPYQLLNPGKKLRFHLFNPFVNHHFIMVEYKAVIFLAEYGCHTKGRNGG